MIDDGEGALAGRPISALPTPTTWEHRSGTTSLGDAAPLTSPSGTSPSGGNGVDLALLDGAELARSIVSALRGGTDLDGIPDFDDAATRWHEDAAAHRRGRRGER